MRGRQRILTLVFALLALQLGSLVSPAWACGCGAMVPTRDQRIGVDRETSVVRWNGRTEQIVMRFTVRGNAQRAAWIMPVPARADVELGDPQLFDDLSWLTRPEEKERHYFWPRSGDWPFADSDGAGAAAPPPGAGGGGVGVVGRERLGPFDVARLTATDPKALSGWLKSNGFELSDRLSDALQPYVDRKWEYVAVRLAPDEKGATLGGDLDPLKIRFASHELIYPMRLSRLAKTPQSLGLYVLADHRMEPQSRIGGAKPEVFYAGRINPEGPVAALTDGKPAYLTAIDQEFPDPSKIDGDHLLSAADSDTPYREYYYTDRLLTVGDGIPVWLLTVLGVLAAAGGTFVAVRRRRRPAAVRSAA
ncbi:DUF2330 domain-containing protein [Streptomyces solicathayae]|uniref:DUF2330 domain-containing protein n=1 Tax=Streptomyces solicathayae TaxID=3081768 RepID=A0ABZ0M4P9_9ACTN|nr:DUF2330 domain-containing protein [Streptomyces sp. HUAS YS2]WOX26756.1 DUF2330 domain-containing protein [Streptomyces sp. HUAS YS2]